MRFSVWPSFQRPWVEVLELARAAEVQGWHGIWSADHYMPDTATGAPDDGPGFECWTTLGGLAAATDRLQLGSLVSPSTVHHPAVLAKQATTVDAISGGRVVLGVGAGWQLNEHRAYGIDLPEPSARVARFAEFVEILRGLLHERRTSLAGRHFTVTDAPCEPKGGPGPVPIMVGSGSGRMLGLAARFADVWNTWGTPEHIRNRSAVLDAACERIGRDPGTIRRTAQALFFLSDDPARIERVRGRGLPDRTVAGAPGELVDRVGEYGLAGVDELIVPDFNLGRSAQERRDALDRFWTEVASPLV